MAYQPDIPTPSPRQPAQLSGSRLAGLSEHQSEKVPSEGRIFVILVRLASVDDLCVIDELNVTTLEIHSDPQVGSIRDGVEEVDRLGLRGRQSRRFGMALRIADIPTDVEEPGHPVDFVEHGQRIGRSLTWGLFVVAIPPERLAQRFNEVWALGQHFVVHRMGVDEPRPATTLGRMEAQQADKIDLIGVEVQALIGLRDADARARSWHQLITDVTEEPSGSIEADRTAEVVPDADVGQLDADWCQAICRKAAEKDEAAS